MCVTPAREARPPKTTDLSWTRKHCHSRQIRFGDYGERNLRARHGKRSRKWIALKPLVSSFIAARQLQGAGHADVNPSVLKCNTQDNKTNASRKQCSNAFSAGTSKWNKNLQMGSLQCTWCAGNLQKRHGLTSFWFYIYIYVSKLVEGTGISKMGQYTSLQQRKQNLNRMYRTK